MSTLTIRGKRVAVKHARSLKLRPVLAPDKGHGNSYCGPAVVSILTGLDTAEAAALLRAITGRMSIKGTSTWSVKEALAYCGIRLVGSSVGIERPTLARWHKDARKLGLFRSSPLWLIVAGNHWQVVTARQFCCGKVKTIRSIRDQAVSRRARVKEAYALSLMTPKAPPKPVEGRPGPRLLVEMLNGMFRR